MRIKQRALLFLAVVILSSLLSVFGYYYTDSRAKNFLELDREVTELLNQSTDFLLLTDDFIRDPNGNAQLKWLEVYEEVATGLTSLPKDDPAAVEIVDGIKVLMRDLRANFADVVVGTRYNSFGDDFDPAVQISELILLSKRFIGEVTNLKFRYDLRLSELAQVRDWVFILIMVVLISVSTFIALYFSLNISRRLEKFSAALQLSAKNNYGTLGVDQGGSDEIGFLVGGVVEMLLEINQSRSNLESKVFDRTKEIRKSNIQTERIIESIGEGIVVVDYKGAIKMVNKKAVNLLKYTEDKLIGSNWDVLFRPHVLKGNTYKDSNLLSSFSKDVRKRVARGVNYCKLLNGEIVPFYLIASKVNLKSKRSDMVIVVRDIRKELAAEKARTEFISLASHQLRTPITAINWFVEALKSTTNLSKKRLLAYLDSIYNSNQRMVKIVDMLLKVAKIDSEDFSFNIERKNLELFVLGLADEFNLDLGVQKKDISLNVKIGKNIGLYLFDEEVLHAILDNIISNAIKYSPNGSAVSVFVKGLKKGVSVGGRKIGEESILFEVRDSGYGIPKEDQAKVFDKLYRASNVYEHDTDGNGLGLYLVKKLVDMVGGKIWFKSKVNQGTVFFVIMSANGMNVKGSRRSSDNVASV